MVPLAATALFWVLALVAHLNEQPDLADPGTLSPTGAGPHGSSLLADRLRAQGVTVIPVTSTDAALSAARRLDATIFVPISAYAEWRLIPDLVAMTERDHRIVFVRPGSRWGILPADAGSRWATQIVDPGCRLPEAVAAGAAAVHRDIYDGARCYGGSLAEFDYRGLDVIVVGATDPFRNDRIDEAGNSALATGLLSAHGQVIWLDVHRFPPVDLPDLDIDAPDVPDYERQDQDRDRTDTGNPLLDSFPERLWVFLILLVGAGVLLAVARGRRLGPPVAEPLPVLVPAAEAVLGRGRLYRRIRARAASLTALRTAAVVRLARVLDPLTRSPERSVLTPGQARDAFVAGIAARAGVPEATVSAILFGPEPEDDQELVLAVADLDRLVTAVIAPTPQPPGGSG